MSVERTEKPDLMLPDEIKPGLGTQILGNNIISYTQTGSTNDVALSLAASGAREGTLVVAENQTKGRGRRNRKWMSPIGTSILASLILRPMIMAHEAHVISLISAAAITQAIRSVTQLPAFIKWPNDIIIGNKKVSGVLVEMRTEKGWVDFLVVGMGVTVNIESAFLPREISEIATSLSSELGYYISRIQLLQEIMRQLEERYIKLKTREIKPLTAEWENLTDTIGRQVRVSLPGYIVRGQAVNIDETGALIIRKHTGKLHRINADELIQLRVDQTG
jgi:BirA family biotin operon repressor/biotin-[acetyl-CoA-carboxylase] ligase